MDHMWAAAKEDGRLTHRGSSGIKAHVKAMVSQSSDDCVQLPDLDFSLIYLDSRLSFP